MYHLIIAAWPEAATVVMVGQETEGAADAAEVYRDYAFQPQLVEVVQKALDAFEVEDACIYGPKAYVTKIANDLNQAFSDITFTIEKAGA